MSVHTHLISTAAAGTATHLSAVERADVRERAMQTMQMLVINEIQQGEPQVCSAFADYCSEHLSGEVTLALCLSRIHGDEGLQVQALAELRAHVDKCQAPFVAAEVDRRIEAAGEAALAEAIARREQAHV